MSKYQALETQLRQWLKEGKKITVEWDCGGDEGLVYPFVDGVEIPYDAPLGEDFYDLLMNKLGLPSAGEYYVKGAGKIIEENEEIVKIEEKSDALQTSAEPITKNIANSFFILFFFDGFNAI